MNDDSARLLRGPMANLDTVRAAFKSGADGQSVLKQYLEEDEELLLPDWIAVDEGAWLAVTSQCLIYCASEEKKDAILPAEAIDLHALSQENDLYVQATDPSTDEPIEWTFQFANGDHERVFEAVTKLVQLHPIHGEDGDNDDDDEMVCAPDVENDEATEEERQAMLDHLDTLLVVPPHLQVSDDDGDEGNGSEGQYDDADDDNLL